MIDISQFTSVAALAVLVGIIVQLVKPTIRPDLIPYLAIVIGVCLSLLIGWATFGALSTPSDFLSYVLGGFFAALLAVGGYEASIDKLKVR